MGIKEVEWCLPEKDKVAFYINIYNKSKPPNPGKPFQMFRADEWREAQMFAACFTGATKLQYVEIRALSPSINGAYEVARVEYWNEDGKVYYNEWNMTAPTIKLLTEKYRCPRVE